MAAPSNLFYIANDKLRVIVHLTPEVSQNSIVSLAHETEGGVVIRTSVNAKPEAGKVNTALLTLLTSEWNLQKSSRSIFKKETSRKKIIKIAEDREIVGPVLTTWIKRRANKNVYLES